MNDNEENIEHDERPCFYTVIFFEKPYGVFTYQYNRNIPLYGFVQVPFGRSIRTGCVWSIAIEAKTPYEIKSILSIQAPPCWDKNMIDFLEFAAKYYKVPLQEVLQGALPGAVRERWLQNKLKTPVLTKNDCSLSSKTLLPALNLLPEQAKIVEHAKKEGFEKILIFGVTGSGKTRCYLEAMRYWLERGNVLYMVPEIHLSHQVITEIERVLECNVFIYHSQVTPKKREEVFLKALSGGKGCVFLTTRSGIFLPFQSLKMIVIDEEHDPSYKQQEGLFRYHARDLALFRAKQLNCVCLMGSATPSAKFLFGPAQPVRFDLLSRATGFALPDIETHSCASPTIEAPIDSSLLKMMQEVLSRGEQVLVYLNQRGYAPRLYCSDCRTFATCPKCLSPLIYHYEEAIGICHHCSWTAAINKVITCQDCHAPRAPIGFGTERLSAFLSDVFPKIAQYKFDSDHVKTPKQVKALLDKIQTKEPALIIGTQMISKGHDWPHVTLAILLVGAFQLKEQLTPFLVQQLLQTAGRSGRHAPGRVVLPISHAQMGQQGLIQALDQAQYSAFTQSYLQEHPEQGLPAAKVFFQSTHLEMMLKDLRSLTHKIEAEGPFMDYPVKRGNSWRAFIQIVKPTRQERSEILDRILGAVELSSSLKKYFLSIEVDPLSLY